MKQLEQAEKSLSGVFKDLPPLPKNAKESLINVMPWIALIFGVLQVIAAYYVWQLADLTNKLAEVADFYAATVGVAGTGLSSFDKSVIYLGAVVLAVEGVIGILAYKGLVARQRRGWDLLFLAALVNVAYAVIAIFIHNRGFGSFLMSLIGSAIGFYLLFQIKDAYTKRSAAAK